jgi:hypothetical protein
MGAGKNVTGPVSQVVPSAQYNKTSTVIYEAGTPIGKELEAPVAPIKTEPLPMNTITSTLTSSGSQQVRTEYAQTPEGILKTTTTTFNPSKLDSSVKAILEKPKQPSIANQIISAPSNFVSSLKTGYETLQNPVVQKIITEKSKENIGRGLAAIFNPEQFQLAYNVYSGTGESPDVIYNRNYETYKTLIEKKDIGGIGLRVAGSPLVVVGGSYVLGAVLGGFAATKIGQTAIATIPRTTLISSKNLITLERALILPEIRITPSLALNTATGVYFTSGMAKSGIESYTSGNIKSFLGTTALSLPFVMAPFKAGYKAGGGYVQRVGAMSTLSDATQRTQQKAIYDMMKTTEKLHEPYLDQKPYDITQVKETPAWQIMEMEKFFKSPVSKIVRKPAIGGSTAMDIQMGEFFRKGGYPERVLEIARERQSQTIQPEMRNVPLKVSGTPGDIDILLGGKFATTKMADVWSGKLDTHVHVSKPGEQYWGGYSTKPFTKSLISFTGEPKDVSIIKWKTLKGDIGHIELIPKYNTGEYVELFHGTTKEAMGSILKNGLKIGVKSRGFKGFEEPFVSATLDLDVAKAYGDKILSIKIPKNEFKGMWESQGTYINEYGYEVDFSTSALQDPYSMGTGERNIAFSKDIPAKYISEYGSGRPVSVKTLSVREQFLRYGHSVLPSNIIEKSYRAYKDVPGFFDTYDVLQFQKGGTKLNEAMDRFLYLERYKAPRVTIGEKFVKGIGGATKINEDWSYGSSKLGYVSSYTTMPKINNIIYGNDNYVKPNIVSTTYTAKDFGYKPNITSTPSYEIKSTDYGGTTNSTYTPSKSTYISTSTDYKRYTPDIPSYTPPTYTPDYKPPTYTPDYKPPTYTPDYKPPTYTPTYNPPPYYPPKYYPDYTPPPPPPNKFKIPSDIDMKKEIKESLGGYNVFIKERHYFKGKKKKPTTWFKASKYPLTKEQALALGATAVDRSAAAAFKIVPTEGEPKRLGFGVDSWGNLSGNFYMKGNTLIEKTPYRINTQGEIKGISALGWLAQRQKPYQSPTKIRYTPTSNAKPTKAPKPINININKIMRGWHL